MYKVNDNCIGCGACVSICPVVFDFNDEGKAENIYGQVDADLDVLANEAMNICPVNAIEKDSD